MNILFVGHNATYSGAPKSLLRIMRYMKKNGHANIQVLLRNDGPLMHEYEAECELYRFLPEEMIPKEGEALKNVTRKLALRKHRKQLLETLKAQKFDVIYANTVVNANVLEFLAPLELPAISHLREMHTAIDAYGGRPMIEQLDMHVNKYIAVSQTAKAALCEYGVAPEKVSVVYNFLERSEIEPKIADNKEDVRAKMGIGAEDVIVGNVGTVNGRKGADLFVEAAIDLLKRHENVHFLWVGGGDMPELDALMSPLPEELKSRIHFPGEIPHPYEYYKEFDILLLTSRDDPFPLTAMEAAYFGKPVICIRGTGGIPEVLEQETALVATSVSAEALVEKLEPVVSNAGQRKELGAISKRILNDELTIDGQMAKILEVVNSLSS